MPQAPIFSTERLLVLALLVIAIGSYFLSPLVLPKSDLMAAPDPDCDLRLRGCGATMPGGGRVTLTITPQPIPTMQPLNIKVSITGIDARKVEIDFSGVDMNMGYNRHTLIRNQTGDLSAIATLPVCVTGVMTWQATLVIETDRQHIAVPFRFASTPH